MTRTTTLTLPAAILLGICACSGSESDDATELPPPADTSTEALTQRAYVVARDHQQMTVIDLRSQEIVGRVATKGVGNHMAEISGDLGKVYVTSADSNELVVVDARTLRVTKRFDVGKHPTHLTLAPDGRTLAVMAEDDNAVVFVDTERDVVRKALSGFFTPHFMRFDQERKYGYVANIGAHHVTRVDLDRLEIESHIALAGFSGPPNVTLAPGEGGFADVQIDRVGRLYAAHNATGRVLVYDTIAKRTLPEVKVGRAPWVVFATHPFDNVPLKHLVPNFGDKTVALIDGGSGAVSAMLPGDEESYGVNFSPKTPQKAFVMNRVRKNVAVVDLEKGTLIDRIAVGGNTETAATTADGAFIVAAVSGANRVVFINPETHAVTKTFTDVGRYPWSVTIPAGQNYCH